MKTGKKIATRRRANCEPLVGVGNDTVATGELRAEIKANKAKKINSALKVSKIKRFWSLGMSF